MYSRGTTSQESEIRRDRRVEARSTCATSPTSHRLLLTITLSVTSSVAAAANQKYDYVFVTTKCIPDIVKTPTLLAPLLSAPYIDEHPQPVYVLMQNGLNVEKDLYHAITALGKGEPRIISSSVFIGTNLIAPNVVGHNDFVGNLFPFYLFPSH